MGTNVKSKKHAINPSFNITLAEDKYYFPGDTLKGTVHLHLQKPTKTNSIKVTFAGEICTYVKDQTIISLFAKQTLMTLPTPPRDDGEEDVKKSKGPITLDAKQHSFEFEFVIPNNLELPSFMELFKEGMIRYTLTCVHDKAHTLGGSSKCEYNVPIIERIDVSDSRFHVPREEIREIPFEALMMGDAHGHGHGNDGFVPKAIVRVNLPKFGYVRGEKITIAVSIKHVYRVKRKGAVTISLSRVGQFISKQLTTVETAIRTSKFDLDIDDVYNLNQVLNEQILIPTGTPPTIDINGKNVYIQYKLVINVNLDDPEKTKMFEKARNRPFPPCTAHIEIPIIVGTLPFATTPIDEDDEDNGDMYTYDLDHDDDLPIGGEADGEFGNHLYRQPSLPRSLRGGEVTRSDSNASHMSTSSVRSQSSISSRSSRSSRSEWALSRNSSTSTNPSSVPASPQSAAPSSTKSPTFLTGPAQSFNADYGGAETPRPTPSMSARSQDLSYSDPSFQPGSRKTYIPSTNDDVPTLNSLASRMSLWESNAVSSSDEADRGDSVTTDYYGKLADSSDDEDDDANAVPEDSDDDDPVSILRRSQTMVVKRNKSRFVQRGAKEYIQLNR